MLQVRTELTGVRYLMQTWFFTFALCVIFCSTFVQSLCIVLAILMLKRLYLLNWL